MSNWMLLAAALLLGVWLIETVLFVLSYRSKRGVVEPSENANFPL